MISYSPILVIAFAGLLHASFQLGIALLTLLSGHSLGSHRSFVKLMRLNLAYFLGAAIVTVLLFTGVAYLALLLVGSYLQTTWFVLSALNIAIGLSVMIFYYRRDKGTGLWIPQPMADYLNKRVKKTDRSAEAFTLGAGSVLAEVPFIVGPLATAVLYTLLLDSAKLQLMGVVIYNLIALSPLYTIVALVGAGSKISGIQKWREENKLFLQYTAGCGLIVLGAFTFVDRFLGGSL